MTDNETRTISQDQLAHIGEGAVAYVREIVSDELKSKFPGMPEIASGTHLWALFAANGQPILLADKRDSAVAGAFQNDLTPVPVH